MAQSMAQAKNADLIRKEMKNEFGITDAEFIALAQNYDISEVYGAIQKTQDSLPEGSKLNKSQFLGSLDIPQGVKLPEGMTAEQALENIYLGYARNINAKPDDKSETHKNMSWGKALKDTLMLDPTGSAEDHLAAMSYMGIPAQEILTYQAASGGRYEPLPGVKRVKGFDIDITDYKESDYMSTANTFERNFTRTFAGTDDLANVTDMATALERLGAEDEAALGNKLRKGGVAIADLELALSQKGLDSQLTRDQALLRLSAEVNTSAEMDNLLAAVENGKASELILESIQRHGKVTDDYIDYILTGNKPEEKPEETITTTTEEEEVAPTVTPTVEEQTEEVLSEPEEPEVTVDEEDVVSTILGNTPDEKERAMEAASKITYEEYEAMSDDEKREAGLPVRDTDFRLAFGYLSPKKYFKGAADQIDVGDVTEETIDRDEVADAAVSVYFAMQDEFPDMSVMKGEDGKQVIKDYLDMNNLPVNDIIVSMIQKLVSYEEE
jgi:hypothetical protein